MKGRGLEIVDGDIVGQGGPVDIIDDQDNVLDSAPNFTSAYKRADAIAVSGKSKKGVHVVNVNNVSTYSYLATDGVGIINLFLKVNGTY